MATHAANMPVDASFGPVGGAILIKSKALDERINRWSPASSGEMSLESTSGEGSYNGSGSSGSSHQSARSTPSARSPVSTGSERLSPLAGITRGGFVSNHDDSSLGTTAMAESGAAKWRSYLLFCVDRALEVWLITKRIFSFVRLQPRCSKVCTRT